MKSSPGRFLFKLVLFVLPIGIGFEVLFRLGYAPIITSSMLFDYKVLQAQKNHIRDVKLMTIGSSVALYEVNSEMLAEHFRLPYYNFACWGMQISDMRVVLDPLVRQYRPSYVLVVSTLWDFTTAGTDSYANYANASSFARTRFPELFYLENYNSIRQIFLRKSTAYHQDFDQWGAGAPMPRDPPGTDRDRFNKMYGFPTTNTARQYKALDSLSAWLHGQQIKLIFAQAPIRPTYINDTSRAKVAAHFDRCREIVEAHGGIYLNYHDTTVFVDSLFNDYPHVWGAGARILTKELVRDLNHIIN